jgi:CRP-like cAMP-binding protein
MPTDRITQALIETEFFRGIGDQYLAPLATLGREVTFPARSTVFEEFDPAQDVYFICEGQVSLAICDGTGCRQIAMLGPGDLLSWSPILGRTRLFDTARTRLAMKAIAFQGDDLLKFCEQNPEFGFRFMQRVAWVLGDRLVATRRRLMEVSGVHLPEFALESD